MARAVSIMTITMLGWRLLIVVFSYDRNFVFKTLGLIQLIIKRLSSLSSMLNTKSKVKYVRA